MSSLGAWLLRSAAQLLEPREREAVLGDLAEAGTGMGLSLWEVFGLVARRQLSLWKSWRPWLAAFGLAFPGSLVLMGYSVSVSRGYQQLLDPGGLLTGQTVWLVCCNLLVLCGLAWSGGFVVGSLSRRTLWVSVAFSFAPCMFCLSRFNVACLSRMCLFLFLLPASWGLARGLRLVPIKRSSAMLLAVGVTALTIPFWDRGGAWIPNWALSWPAWYLVATGRRSDYN
ncbi:MAG: hypothetical protein NTZ56_04355 [Acidobacteria bacterium]|nr:hypothetical protein [Acidobacteriota bacterium]